MASMLFNEHCVAEGKHAVLVLNGVTVGFMMLSRFENALTSIIRVERGTWKLVTIASTTWNS